MPSHDCVVCRICSTSICGSRASSTAGISQRDKLERNPKSVKCWFIFMFCRMTRRLSASILLVIDCSFMLVPVSMAHPMFQRRMTKMNLSIGYYSHIQPLCFPHLPPFSYILPHAPFFPTPHV